MVTPVCGKPQGLLVQQYGSGTKQGTANQTPANDNTAQKSPTIDLGLEQRVIGLTDADGTLPKRADTEACGNFPRQTGG